MKVGDLVQLRHGTLGILTNWSIDDSSDVFMKQKVWHVLVDGSTVFKVHESYHMIKVINEVG